MRFCDTAQKTNSPLGEFDDLHTAAVYGMEVCPAYFGSYPVPAVTPWGYTARHRTIHNGVYWIETDRCVPALAVCYVIQHDFSNTVRSLSALTAYDRDHGLDETMGSVFFRGDDICLPILELMQGNRRWDWNMVDKPALMNAVWARFPEYAAAHNMLEQQGLNDGFGLMLRALSIPGGLHSSLDNMIAMTPDAGVRFLKFL